MRKFPGPVLFERHSRPLVIGRPRSAQAQPSKGKRRHIDQDTLHEFERIQINMAFANLGTRLVRARKEVLASSLAERTLIAHCLAEAIERAPWPPWKSSQAFRAEVAHEGSRKLGISRWAAAQLVANGDLKEALTIFERIKRLRRKRMK